MAKRKRQKWQDGDLFLVPQSDGGFTLGQVLSYQPRALNSVLCVFTLTRVNPGVTPLPPSMDDAISIQFVTIDLLNTGDWPVVGHAPLPNFRTYFDLQTHLDKVFVGTKIYGSGIMISFLNACFGLEPWDKFFDPNYMDKILLSPDKKPKHLVYKTASAR